MSWRTQPDAGSDVPAFDVLMLGVGPDAHVASLFPEHPALHERSASTVGVRGAPKPPPVRVSLTFPALCAARDVWFLVCRCRQGRAVGLALSGAGEMQAPAAGVTGAARHDLAARPRRRRARAAGAGPAQPAPERRPTPARRRTGTSPAAGPGDVRRRGISRWSADQPAVAQRLQRLVEDRLAVGVAAPLLHVGEVGLVRLGARRRRRVRPGPARPGSRSAGSPRSRGPAAGSSAKLGRVSWPLAHQ